MDQKLSTHSLQHYYVAVGTACAKLDSLIELITALEGTGPLSMAICCGSRDVLDAVAAALQAMDRLSLWALHSDMSEREIEGEVRSFRRAAAAIAARVRQGAAPEGEAGAADGDDAAAVAAQEAGGDEDAAPPPSPVFRPLCVLLTTDAPLRAVHKDLLPLSPTLLVNFDIPTRKEDYTKRVGAVLGGRARAEGPRLTLNFTEAGRVAELRQLEAFAEREVREMPVHVGDVFATRGRGGGGGGEAE